MMQCKARQTRGMVRLSEIKITVVLSILNTVFSFLKSIVNREKLNKFHTRLRRQGM